MSVTFLLQEWGGNVLLPPPPPPAPVIDFSGTPLSGVAPFNVSFTDLSSNSPLAWNWKKNGGSGAVAFSGTPTAQNPIETFSVAGTYDITLEATNATGAGTPVTKTGYITVTNPPPPPPGAPVADFTGTPTSGSNPLSVVFTDASTNTPTSWHWEYQTNGGGYGDFTTPTVQNPTQVFPVGSSDVRLTATNAGGSSSPAVKLGYITVSPAPTDPWFSTDFGDAAGTHLDAVVPDVGTSFNQVNGIAVVNAAHRLRVDASNADGGGFVSDTPPSASYRIDATFRTTADVADMVVSSRMYLTVRDDVTDTHGYYVRLSLGNNGGSGFANTLALVRNDTSANLYTTTIAAPVDTDIPVAVQCQGSTISLEYNSVVLYSTTDTTWSAAGKVHLDLYTPNALDRGDGKGIEVSSFSVTSVTSPPGPPPSPPGPPTPPVPPSPPSPPSPPGPPPPPNSLLDTTVIGGWRLQAANAFSGLAVDHDNQIAGVATAGGSNAYPHYGKVLKFNLPAMGTDPDFHNWPIVYHDSSTDIPNWPDAIEGNQMFVNDVLFDKTNAFGFGVGKIILAPKRAYEAAPTQYTIFYSEDGDPFTVNGIPRQSHSGFIERHGQHPWLGNGGTQSGQGAASGPTAGDFDGTIFLTWPYGSLNPADRELGLNNYFVSFNYVIDHVDRWYALDPINHGGQGYWASNQIYGGAIQFSDGLVYYVNLASKAQVDYQYQNPTLSSDQCCTLYAYDPSNGWSLSFYYEYVTLYGGFVVGMALDTDGTGFYTCEGNAWGAGDETPYKVQPVLFYRKKV